jgi:hypothetical protein
MKKKISLLIREEGGAITVMAVIMIFAFLGILAVVIDLGHLHTVQNELRNAADACALRGARAFYADDALTAVEDSVTRGSAGIPQAQALETVTLNYTDTNSYPLQTIQDVAIGVWDYEASPPGWLGGTPEFSLWDPTNTDLYGRIIGPGIRLNVNRVDTDNYGPVGMTLANIFKIFEKGKPPSVDVRTEATAALSPVGEMGTEEWNKTGTPPPIRIGDDEFQNPEPNRIFTLYPNNTQAGGWHSYDVKNPNPNLFENFIWGKDTKTEAPITIPTLTAGESGINLQNGVDSVLFQVPDPTKPNDPNQYSLISRWLQETNRIVVDPKVPTYEAGPGGLKDWVVWLPVTDSDQATGVSTVLGFARVAIDWINPPPDKTIMIKILEPYVAPPGTSGGGKYFGIIAIDPKLVK